MMLSMACKHIDLKYLILSSACKLANPDRWSLAWTSVTISAFKTVGSEARPGPEGCSRLSIRQGDSFCLPYGGTCR